MAPGDPLANSSVWCTKCTESEITQDDGSKLAALILDFDGGDLSHTTAQITVLANSPCYQQWSAIRLGDFCQLPLTEVRGL